MSEHASAWKSLIDEWVERERTLHPAAPVRSDSVRVRDSVEVDDQAFVLVSYDVEYPWPQEEDTVDDGRSLNTAVLQAMRVRQPWIERDATRAMACMVSEDGAITLCEHVLGVRRAFAGHAPDGIDRVTLHFDGGERTETSVVDGWFLAVVPEAWRVSDIEAGDSMQPLVRHEPPASSDLLSGFGPAARGTAPTMYFSPLDLRNVHPLVRWERSGNVVVVASSLEQYDEGGIIRLRIDGIRADDDLFVSWPLVSIEVDGMTCASAPCGEYGHKDTISLDIGFRPWLRPDTDRMVVVVSGLRGVQGMLDDVRLELALRSSAQ